MSILAVNVGTTSVTFKRLLPMYFTLYLQVYHEDVKIILSRFVWEITRIIRPINKHLKYWVQKI